MQGESVTPRPAPIPNGHIAEAVAMGFLGGAALWIGGRNAGHDIVLDGVKIDVKSGDRKNCVVAKGAKAVPCIGIRLNKGLAGLDEQDVDDLLVVVRKRYSGSEARVSSTEDRVHVELAVDVHGVAVYRVSKTVAKTLFGRPFKHGVAQHEDPRHKSEQNLVASIESLEKYRVPLPRR